MKEIEIKERLLDSKNCPFCFNLEGHRRRFLSLYPNTDPNLVLLGSNRDFLVTAELHPIIDAPYFLVIPRHHFFTFSEINIDYHDSLNRLIANFIFPASNNFVIFEHGTHQSLTDKVKSVSHAHCHLILPPDGLNFLFLIEHWLKNENMREK